MRRTPSRVGPVGSAPHAGRCPGQELETAQTRLVTTQAVLLEIGNALSNALSGGGRGVAASLEADPSVVIVPFTPGLYAKAFDLYRSRLNKEWGLIDCASFVVMKSRGITEASRRR